jgi:hypothetical protein
MTNSFGGFSGNSDIEDFLSSIQSDFVSMVISNSVILNSYQSKQDEVIRIASRQVYPRIGLRLSAAKNIDNSPLFSTLSYTQAQLASIANSNVRLGLYENVVALMTDISSPYAQGITNVAASLVAAILIKQININNDIKNIDLGDSIEKNAFADLDRIVDLYKGSEVRSSIDTSLPLIVEESIYIALDLDKTTLPANYFNVGSVNEVINIEKSQPSANVRTLDSLTIPPDKLAFGWYFISGTEYEDVSPTDTDSLVPKVTILPPLEGAFLVNNTDTSEDIVSNLADELNDAGLSRDTNIIASPNLGSLTTNFLSISKKKLYPNELAKTYDKKVASFKVQTKLDYLTFTPRRRSSIVNRELIILRFFTLDKVTLASYKLAALPEFTGITFTYNNNWSISTAYTKGQIVDYNNKVYVCKQNSTGNIPSTSTAYWISLYATTDELVNYKSISEDYIEGLVYGLTNNFATLDKKGPKSILLDVEKGDLKVVSSNNKVDKGTNLINTFYFKLTDSSVLINGVLKLRVASTKLLDVPEIFSFLNLVDKTLDITFTNATAEDVALEILKAVYQISQYTDVLSALVYPNALELTAFKRTKEEVQEVIDILQLPSGLDIATGTSIIEKTPYKNKARSLVIEAINIPSQLRRHAPIDNDSGSRANSGQVVLLQADKSLQTVKDKLNFLYQTKTGGYWYV